VRVCVGEGSLVIQFQLLDDNNVRAIDAVENLKQRLLPDRQRRRRDVASTAGLITSTIDNRTITPTGIYSWTGQYCQNRVVCHIPLYI